MNTTPLISRWTHLKGEPEDVLRQPVRDFVVAAEHLPALPSEAQSVDHTGPQSARQHVVPALRKIMVLLKDLWFYEEPSPTGEPFFVWGTFIGSLKNYLSKLFFKEPWFERFFVEPDMVP